jgi:hypothetical protein
MTEDYRVAVTVSGQLLNDSLTRLLVSTSLLDSYYKLIGRRSQSISDKLPVRVGLSGVEMLWRRILVFCGHGRKNKNGGAIPRYSLVFWWAAKDSNL